MNYELLLFSKREFNAEHFGTLFVKIGLLVAELYIFLFFNYIKNDFEKNDIFDVRCNTKGQFVYTRVSINGR